MQKSPDHFLKVSILIRSSVSKLYLRSISRKQSNQINRSSAISPAKMNSRRQLDLITLQLILFASISFMCPTSVAAEPTILSGQLGETLWERSYSQEGYFSITPDGSKVLYSARSPELVSSEEFGYELYMVNIDGSNPVRLLDHTSYRYFSNPVFSSDSKLVVLEANLQLLTIDLTTKSITTLTNSQAERVFKISPDDQFVVFTNLLGSDFNSVPISGGEIKRLDATSIDSFDSNDFEITHDSQQVIFSLRDLNTGVSSLKMVPIRGGTNTELLPLGDHDLLNWQISPGDGSVLYQLYSTPPKLHSVDLQTLTKTVIASSNGDGFIRYWIAPNSSSVVYTKHETNSSSPLKVYLTDTVGASHTELSTTMSHFSYICDFGYSANSDRAILCGYDETGSAYFYSIDLTGAPTVQRLLPDTPISNANLKVEFARDLAQILAYSRIKTEVAGIYEHTLLLVDVANNSSTTLFNYQGINSSCRDERFSIVNSTIAYCSEYGNAPLDSGLYTYKDGEAARATNEVETPVFFKLNSTAREVVYMHDASTREMPNSSLRARRLEGDDDGFLCFPVAPPMQRPSVICL